MPLAGTHARRILLIAFALCAMVCVQAASIAAEQETHHASDHCCGLCHLGPAPVLPAAASTLVAPVFSPVWLATSAIALTPREVMASSSGSRAPPASV
jgi:hypothetical protein